MKLIQILAFVVTLGGILIAAGNFQGSVAMQLTSLDSKDLILQTQIDNNKRDTENYFTKIETRLIRIEDKLDKKEDRP